MPQEMLRDIQHSLCCILCRRDIRLTDSPTNDLATTTTAADYIFPVQGTWGSFKDGIITTRTVQTRRESVRSENIVTNVFGKNIQRSAFTKLLGFTDPLSQSFYVDPAIYPSGIFTKKVTLYFKKKDSNANTPVSMVLRPVVNGYPHPSKFIPLSDITCIVLRDCNRRIRNRLCIHKPCISCSW
jgi:hypothetical protein